MGNVAKYAMMRAIHDEECQALHQIIEYMNGNHVHDGTRTKADGRSPGTWRTFIKRFQGLGRQDLGGGSGTAGEKAGDEGAFEGMEEN